MNKEIEKGLVPKLRFSEFKSSGGWEEKTLGEVTQKVSVKNKSGTKYPIYSINNKNGFVPQSEQFDGIDSNKRGYDITLYNLIQKNTFAYNPARINVGSIGYSGELNNIIISSLYVCFKTKKTVHDIFFLFFFETFFFSEAVHSNVEGGIRNYLFYENFSKIKVTLPSIPEQTKIAACLSSLDDLINAQTQKIEALKTHKKSLMQQLFPQEGETVPKLRFPEFENEWEWKELNNLASKVNVKNKNFEVKVVLTNSASYGIVRQDSYFDREIVTQGNLTGYYVVDVDDFIYNPRISNNALVGSLKRNNLIKGVMSPLYTVFRFKQGNLSFFEHYFETIFWHGYMKNLANTGARHDRLNISNEDFFNLPLPFPTLPEQQKIADCLSSLDDLINTHVKQCGLLKIHKKGLMQGLFPSSNEAA